MLLGRFEIINGRHQLPVYFYDVNILGESVRTVKRNTETLVVASKKTVLEVNAEKSKYMIMSRDQNAVKNHNMKTDNKSLETVELFTYFGTALKDMTYFHEYIKSKLKSGNACYHSMQNLTSSSLFSKNINFKPHRTIILSVFCMGVKTGC